MQKTFAIPSCYFVEFSLDYNEVRLCVTGITGTYLSVDCSVIQGGKNDYPSRWKSINESKS